MSYSTITGRWFEADPTGAEYVDGPNLYPFVRDNPVNGVDPTGMLTVDDWSPSQALEHWKSGGGGPVYISSGPFVSAIKADPYIQAWIHDIKAQIDSIMLKEIIPDMRSKGEKNRTWSQRFPKTSTFDSNMPGGKAFSSRWYGMGTIHHYANTSAKVWKQEFGDAPGQSKLGPSGTCAYNWSVDLDIQGFDRYHSFATSGSAVSTIAVFGGGILNELNPWEWFNAKSMLPVDYDIYWGWKEQYIGGKFMGKE